MTVYNFLLEIPCTNSSTNKYSHQHAFFRNEEIYIPSETIFNAGPVPLRLLDIFTIHTSSLGSHIGFKSQGVIRLSRFQETATTYSQNIGTDIYIGAVDIIPYISILLQEEKIEQFCKPKILVGAMKVHIGFKKIHS